MLRLRQQPGNKLSIRCLVRSWSFLAGTVTGMNRSIWFYVDTTCWAAFRATGKLELWDKPPKLLHSVLPILLQ